MISPLQLPTSTSLLAMALPPCHTITITRSCRHLQDFQHSVYQDTEQSPNSCQDPCPCPQTPSQAQGTFTALPGEIDLQEKPLLHCML